MFGEAGSILAGDGMVATTAPPTAAAVPAAKKQVHNGNNSVLPSEVQGAVKRSLGNSAGSDGSRKPRKRSSEQLKGWVPMEAGADDGQRKVSIWKKYKQRVAKQLNKMKLSLALLDAYGEEIGPNARIRPEGELQKANTDLESAKQALKQVSIN